MGSERQGALILNVNDNEVARYLVTTILQRAGFQVIEAANGRQALDRVEDRRPDLVVLDVQLPDISGLEVCAQIRKSPAVASIKVLHTSATHINVDSKVMALRGGADGYLTQPFESEELVATIDALLRLSRTEEELRATAEQLREADRRKNEFLAMLAHELRNPLAAIWAALPVLERHAPHDEVEAKARHVLERQSGQLKRLIDDLLDVARVTQGKIELRQESVELTRLLAQVIDNVQRTSVARRKQRVVVDLGPDPVYVRGDSLRLEQVFANVLDNASKYTQEEGSIWDTLGCDKLDGASKAVVEVRDNGMGMAPETLPQIFSLFAQADVPLARSTGGLGIGLTLVRRLVELHGGWVSAASEGLGKGSTLRVSLPALARDARAPSVRKSAAELRRDVPRRVLVVEDNEDLQTLTVDQLRGWGHEVNCASDGREGFAKFTEWRPEVALIDIGLPGVDGFELARQIRALNGEAYLIAMTGYSSRDKRSLAIECGCDQVLVKPVEASRLRGLLNELPRRAASVVPPAPRDVG
ncbi:MAG TPA: response regulator [Polyangiales bacterium]